MRVLFLCLFHFLMGLLVVVVCMSCSVCMGCGQAYLVLVPHILGRACGCSMMRLGPGVACRYGSDMVRSMVVVVARSGVVGILLCVWSGVPARDHSQDVLVGLGNLA